jgi:type IV pilus assembly protein PilF
MRLRDAGFVLGVAVAVAAVAGCGMIRGKNGPSSHYQLNTEPQAHFSSKPSDPHRAAQNEIALAQEYIKTQQYEVALHRLERAIKLDPKSPDGYTMLGLLNERINRPVQAEAAYAKAVALGPDKGDILNNYGAWLCRSGHPNQADPLFRKALADPFYQTPQVALGNAATCATKAGKPGLAESYERQILGLDANNPDALRAMAGISFQHGDYLRARGFIERFLAAGSAAPDVLDLAAQVEDKLGDRDSAKAYRTRLATEFPTYISPSHP